MNAFLSKLNESAERPEKGQAGLHELSSQRIEHHVDTLSVRHLAYFIHETDRSRIKGVRDAERLQKGAFFGGAGGGVDFSPKAAGDLYRGETDSPCCGMNEHALPCADPCLVVQCIPGSKKCDRDSRRLFEPEVGRFED